MGLNHRDYAHLPIGELSDKVEMYQRIHGYAEPDIINSCSYVPNLK